MEFQLGETYHGYQFLDILKRSKNGIEFRVRNTMVGRLEVLRALAESAKNDEEQSERFAREMRVHAGLLHPNIVTLFNAIEIENHLIITTELVEGPTMADKLLLDHSPARRPSPRSARSSPRWPTRTSRESYIATSVPRTSSLVLAAF